MIALEPNVTSQIRILGGLHYRELGRFSVYAGDAILTAHRELWPVVGLLIEEVGALAPSIFIRERLLAALERDLGSLGLRVKPILRAGLSTTGPRFNAKKIVSDRQ
jgi:hypothetical protein